MNNCVAINIMVDGKVVNKNQVPILFYWDGMSDIEGELRGREDFLEFLYPNVVTKAAYTKSSIAYFYFVEDEDGNEIYNEHTEDIQDWLSFEYMGDAEFALAYTYDIVKDLYKKVFTTEYVKNAKDKYEDAIMYMYTTIKSKYNTRLNNTTFIEYIRVELNKQETELSKDNIRWLFAYITKMLAN